MDMVIYMRTLLPIVVVNVIKLPQTNSKCEEGENQIKPGLSKKILDIT